jgi:hypothetical protein
MVAYNPTTQEAQLGGLQISGKSGLHSKTLFQNKQTNKTKNKQTNKKNKNDKPKYSSTDE